MAEYLNGYFSSVFTKEDISSLPAADAKFQGAKSDYLGPLVVTPEMVLIYINDLDDSITSNVLKFADDTKLFRKVNTDGDKHHL